MPRLLLNRTFSVNKVERPLSRLLKLPRWSIRSPWINAGLKLCANRRVSHVLHMLWGAVYAICGTIQFVAGIYFMLELPIFQIGSNIWTGAWNCFSGITVILLGCAGSISTLRAQGFLLLSLVVTIVNLVNLVILEVGEWRGFLSSEDRDFIKSNQLEAMMYSAYLCTTISTVLAMIVSFLASQHAFCFQQLLAEKEIAAINNNNNKNRNPNGNIVHHHNFDEEELDDSLMPKDLIKRHDDDLNLKTPSGPQPHPSWVYRHNYAPFHSVARTATSTSTGGTGAAAINVKRSLSFLKSSSGSSTLLKSQESSTAGNTTANGIRTLSEAVSHREAAAAAAANGKGGRHAVIRRHQSMYIHPRATELVPPSSFAELPAFHMQEASGKSEVRPIVTLKRSKTTVGQMPHTTPASASATSAVLNYRGSATLQPPRTFRSNSVAKQMKLYDHNHNIYGTNKRKSHHYLPFDDICEFQAGPSFDLPDREKMRRYGWSSGNIGANGHCVLLETEQTQRGSTTSYLRPAQEDLSTDSCGENIRYQAVEGLVQNSRHQMGPKAHLLRSANYSSSMENLLSERSNEDDPSVVLANAGLVRYGSTGSISSLGSNHLEHHHHHQNQNLRGILTNGGGGPTRTYTPSSLYSQDSSSALPTTTTTSFGVGNRLSSTESVLIYDAIPKTTKTSLKKSNSRVSSTGKLRLRVESFRKSSSGTQTEISAIRKKKDAVDGNSNSNSSNNNNNDAKYTAQYKKHTAPHKPARKHKPKVNANEPTTPGESGRSDRSASPDNSSTSGYSSPSAGLHSKESSPCGSKIPSPPHSLEQTSSSTTDLDKDNANNEEIEEEDEEEEEEDQDSANTSHEEDRHDDSGRLLDDENITGEEDYEEDDDNRITVIQIEGQEKDKKDSGSESNYSSGSPIPPPPNSNNNNPHHRQESKLEQNNSNTLPFVRPNRRELPRIVTNGTLGRPNSTISNPQTFPTKTRRLPDRSHFQNIQNNNNNSSTAQQDSSSSTTSSNRYFHSQPHHQQQQRIYRSNLPRPSPIHHFGPGRVPLPPVPELERSDHERESMSPTPSSSAPSPRSGSVASGSNGHAYRPLPSPLTTPIQPAIGRVQAKPRRSGGGVGGGGLLRQQEQQQKTLSPSRIPRASSNERDYSPSRQQQQQQPKMEMEKQQQQQGNGKQVVDERLRVLLSLLETGKENADNVGREDTLQYLSQLESVARRLKDQLLQDAVAPTHGPTTQQNIPTHDIESDC